ncbi:hypothetical protein L195_g043537 [Trifolium pratense]|uniref:Uncharacterized protein n=1 Tax=Trifolium pratense TaxID=57577 RepID=A0A2K3M9J2_TRIPR|nr:hypothetical protein L195_g043537 [Trifolium pratense]
MTSRAISLSEYAAEVQVVKFTMVDYDESVDVDSNEVRSTNGHTSDDEDATYSVSNVYDSSDDGDDTDNDHDDDDAGNDHDFDDDAV